MQFNYVCTKGWTQPYLDKLQQLVDQYQLATKYAEMTELINATGDNEFDLIWFLEGGTVEQLQDLAASQLYCHVEEQ